MAGNAKTKRASTERGDTYVALLRGINVGGKNKLPMADLVAIFAAAGCRDVRTYIQSGNVVFVANATTAKRVSAVVSNRIADDFELNVPVVTRSAAELSKAARSNPFLKQGVDPVYLHVAFLAETPARSDVTKLDPNRSPGDTFDVRGREVYLHLPNGVARTKLTTAYFDSALGTVSTVRNWRTVLKLLEMAAVAS